MNKSIIAIVLGNRLNDDGTISKIQKERLEMVEEVEELFNPKYYILSGGLANKKAGITEAKAMYNYLEEKGIDKTKLILEDKSLTTIQNAANSVPIAKSLGADIILVITSKYHFADYQYEAMSSFIEESKKYGLTVLTYCSK